LFDCIPEIGELDVGIAPHFGLSQDVDRHVFKMAETGEGIFEFDELADIFQEPRIDAGKLVDLVDRQTHFERIADIVESSLAGDGQFFFQPGIGNWKLFSGFFACIGAVVWFGLIRA